LEQDVTTIEGVRSVGEQQYPSSSRAWFCIALIFFASLVSWADRAAINLVVGSIRSEFAISNTQIGLLQGPAFGVSYAAGSIIFGVLVDRLGRKGLFLGGMVIWSVGTIVTGLATTFFDALAARIIIGFGEAVINPVAASLICDYFRPERRGTAISIFQLGSALGVGVAFAAGGAILQMVSDGLLLGIPWLGQLHAWRVLFIILGGGGGAILLIFVSRMQEPPRRYQDKAPLGRGAIAYFLSNWKVFPLLWLSYTFVCMADFGFVAWMPTLIEREYGLSNAAAGELIGSGLLISSVLGIACGGLVSDAASRRDGGRSRLIVGIGGAMIAILAAALILIKGLAFPLAALWLVDLSTWAASIAIMVAHHERAAPEHRGKAASLLTITNITLGAGLGPVLVGFFNDGVFQGTEGLSFSIAAMSIPACMLSAALLIFILRSFEPRTSN